MFWGLSMKSIIFQKAGILLITYTLLLGSTFVVSSEEIDGPSNNRAITLFVGGNGSGNYTTIQSAIDNATAGDSIYVYNGTYNENILIDIQISLLGEDAVTTIIDGGQSGDVITVSGNDVLIRSCTIRNAGTTTNHAGILITGTSSTVEDCIISNNHLYGIYIYGSTDNNILNNTIQNNGEGIRCWYSSSNNISENQIEDNEFGIRNWNSNQNTIINNVFSNNDKYGAFIYNCSQTTIIQNSIDHSLYGIRLWSSTLQPITNNHIMNNSCGIYFDSTSGNNVVYNNYFSNNENINNSGIGNTWNISLTPGSNIINGSYIGGNYWNDYNGYDTNGDGIGDTNIPHPPGDSYPLVRDNQPPIANFLYVPLNPTAIDTVFFTDNSTDPDGTSDIVNWSWDFGDGTVSYQQHANHSYSSNGIFTVVLTVRDTCGASDSSNQTITVPNIPAYTNFTYDPLYPITSDTVHFTSISFDYDGYIVNWTWDFGDGNYGYGEITSHMYGNGSYTVILLTRDDDGATNFSIKTIDVVNVRPEVDFTFLPPNPTTADIIQFIDQSSDRDERSIVNWTWDFDDGTIRYAQNPTHRYDDNGTYSVMLTISDDDGAINATVKIVNVSNIGPTVNFSYIPLIPSTADTISFADNSSDPDGIIVNWTWIFGDGNTSHLQNPTHQYAQNGTYSICLWVTDDDGVTNMTCQSIIVSNTIPIVNFTYTPLHPTTNQNVTFNDTSYDPDGFIVNWTWDFGDGTLSYEQHPVHQYSDNGTYTVNLIITDNNGEHNSTFATLTVLNINPSVSFTFYPATPSTADTVQFTDTSYDTDGIIVNWTWDFGDGTISYEQNPTNQYDDNGTYSVSLLITDDDGYTNSTNTTVIVTNAVPTPNFAWTPMHPTTLDTIHFLDLSTDRGIISWAWDFDDGNISSLQNPYHHYAESGVYNVTLFVSDDDGAVNSCSKLVTVYNIPPVANFTYSPLSPSTFENVSFTDTSTDADGNVVNWTWDFGDGTMSYQQHPIHQYTDNGTYLITLYVQDDDADTNSFQSYITVSNVAPTANFTFSPLSPSTADNITFTDLSFDPDGVIVSWLWDFDDGYGSTTKNATHQFTDNGIYNVTLTIHDDDGFSNSIQKQIIVSNVAPYALFIYEPVSPTTIDIISFTDTSYDTDGFIVNWSWDFGDGNISYLQNPQHYYSSPGNYSVNLTIIDDDNSSSVTTQLIYVGGIPSCFDEVWVDDGYNSSVWGWQITHFDTIQDGINAVCPGGIVHVDAGTYVETLNLLDKELTIDAAGQDHTIINASSLGGYALSNFGNHSTIRDFTLIGTDTYGFKVSGSNNITLENITVKNSGRTGIDLNGVNDSTLANIKINDTVNGFGLMILDSRNISVSTINTSGNSWGGVSIQSRGFYYMGGCDRITFSGGFYADEPAPLLIEKDPPSYYDITNVVIPDIFEFVVYDFRDDDDVMQWFYQETLSDAKDFANALLSSPYSCINMLIFDISKVNYHVIAGFVIQDSIDDSVNATIHVDTGVYLEDLSLYKKVTIQSTSGASTTFINGNALYTVDITADNVILDGFTVINGWTAPYDWYDADPSTILIRNGSENVRIINNVLHAPNPGNYTNYGSMAVNIGPSENSEIASNEITMASSGVSDYVDAIRLWGNNDTYTATNVQIHDNYIHDITDGWGVVAGFMSGSATITMNNISGLETGVVIRDNRPEVASLTIEYNNIAGNSNGLENYHNDTTIATCNWWGNLTGPYHSDYPDGTGDVILGNVSYAPWLTDEYPYGDCNGYPYQIVIDVNQTMVDRGFPIRHAIDGDWGAAQNFTPTVSVITSSEIYLRKFGVPEFDLIIEIRESSPIGSLLDTIEFDAENVSSSWEWLFFNISNITVNPGTDYFIVIPPAPSGVTTSFGYEWGYALGDQYPDGSFWFTRDGGDLWRDLPDTYEFTFTTYGIL